MNKEYISELVKDIFIKHLELDNNYFSQYSDDGDNLYIVKDLGCDILSRYEILNDIEKKCGILFGDDDVIWKDDLTIFQYIECIYQNLEKNKFTKF